MPRVGSGCALVSTCRARCTDGEASSSLDRVASAPVRGRAGAFRSALGSTAGWRRYGRGPRASTPRARRRASGTATAETAIDESSRVSWCNARVVGLKTRGPPTHGRTRRWDSTASEGGRRDAGRAPQPGPVAVHEHLALPGLGRLELESHGVALRRTRQLGTSRAGACQLCGSSVVPYVEMDRGRLVRALLTGGIVLTALWCAALAVAIAILIL